MGRKKNSEETVSLILSVASKSFMEKGYEQTTLQDIINQTGLSKGAIYHHFDSKEEIFTAICGNINKGHVHHLEKIRDDKTMSGKEKLQTIFQAAIENPIQGDVMGLAPNFLDNPKFLAMEIRELYSLVVPNFIEPILAEGIADGSIDAANPKELAEAIMTLANVWLNPLIYPCDVSQMERKCQVFKKLLLGLNLDFWNDEMTKQYMEYCAIVQNS